MARKVTISTINVDIKANSKGLERGINESTKRMGRFGDQMRSIGLSFARFAAAMAPVIAAVAALAKGFQAATRAMMELDSEIKEARRLQMSPNLLAGVELLEQQAGLASGSLNRMFDEMEKRIGETIMGTGEARIAFDRLGLSAKDLSELLPEDQMAAIAAELLEVENNAERAALGNQIFGRNAKQLDLILSQLAAGGVQQYREQAMLLRGDMEQSAAAVERQTDNIGELGVAYKGLWEEIGRTNAEFLESDFGQAALLTVARNIGFIRGAISDTETAAEAAADAMRGMYASSTDFSDQIEAAREHAKGTNEEFQQMGMSVGLVSSAVGGLLINADQVVNHIEHMNAMWEEGRRLAERWRSPIEVAADEMNRVMELFDAGVISSKLMDTAWEGIVSRLIEAEELAEAVQVAASGEIGATRGGGLSALRSAQARQANRQAATAENMLREARAAAARDETRNTILERLRAEMSDRATGDGVGTIHIAGT